MTKIIRVFPRRNKATPTDQGAAINRLPSLFDEADKIQISATFTWDIPRAEFLAQQWQIVAPVEIGGPAYGDPGAEFEPGRFLQNGYTITSRGCPSRCKGCFVPEREGSLRQLPIKDGWNLLDNNILACTRDHIKSVFSMLSRQPHRAKFTGGLEAARLRSWHVDQLIKLKPDAIWMAYDRPGEWEPLTAAVAMLKEAGIVNKSKRVGCYVLMGWPGDTIAAAETRLRAVIGLGIKTQAMWLNNGGESKPDEAQKWRDLRRHFTNPRTVGKMISEAWDE